MSDRRDRRTALPPLVLAGGLALLALGAAQAQKAPGRADALGRLAFGSGRLAAGQSVAPLTAGAPQLLPPVRDGWAAFRLAHDGEWRGFVDRRTGLLAYAEGKGIPWIPGRGNRLTAADVAPFLAGKSAVDLAALERIARAFLAQTGKLLGVEASALALDRGRSGQAADYLWFVDFQVLRGGRVVEGARLTFTVNHGNLIQFGTVALPPADAAVPPLQVTREQALATVAKYVGGARGGTGGLGAGDRLVDPGSLHLLPVDAADGRRLLAVWDLAFRREGVTGTWRGQVDATTGELLAFADVNDYAQVTGGVYPSSFATDAEVVRPMPFASLSTGVFTDSAGGYEPTGGTATTNLFGPYVTIYDTCGSVAQSSGASGNIRLDLSAGTDCATPDTGGPGNTHASRMQFYQVNRVREIGRGWLPGNTWLAGQLPVDVNLNAVCNAYWNGFTLNFYRSGAGCGNTGEIAAVSLHEYGHGLDQNDGGGASPDGGTRESYADVTAALVTHDSCGGPGFFLAGTCGGYGDPCTSCSAVRDIDWAKHASGAPHTVANFTQPSCPGFGNGPCGREAHCESYVASEAVWDLAARDLPGAGTEAAWTTVERLWYRSRAAAGSAFTCNTAPATWTSDGCAAGSLWRVLRAADDDDGDLTNGTPHSCALYAALDRHGIACPADPAAATCFAACTPPAAPVLTATPGLHQVRLDWTGAGPGMVYDVYKSELSCGAGFARVATGVAGLAYLDTTVADGLGYHYQVAARPAGDEACAGAPSACQSAAAAVPACTLAAPAALTATAVSPHRVDLAWSAVAGADDYGIYRAAASGGPYALVRSVAAPATSWSDTALASGTAVYYTVRARADCESAASPEAVATPFPCLGAPLYSNDFESGGGLADWSTSGLLSGGVSEWRGIETCAAHSGQHVFRFGGVACGDTYDVGHQDWAQIGGAAGIAVPAGTSDARLSFWHRWDFEQGFDGGSVQLALDGGAFNDLPPSVYLAGPPSLGTFFSGTQPAFVQSIVDLDAACDLAGAGGTGCAGRTVFVRFFASTDSVVNGQGWFLDDVAISACTPHGCTGAPGAPSATAPADGEIQVAWANGAPPSASFDVYRAIGTCAAPGPFTRVASQAAGSPFLDNGASGTLTYAYRVTGLEGTGQCESDPSACVQATATGPCTAAPVFAGLAAATNAAASVCSVGLSWPAAVPLCGGPVTYDVYRSTSPTFTPAPANRIAAGVAATSFADPGPLGSGTAYSYVVRAADGANGAHDANLVRRSAVPTGASSVGTFAETFEGTASGGGFDNPGWSHGALSGAGDWSWSTAVAESPTHSWSSPTTFAASDRALVSPPFGVLAGTSLSFWHAFEFVYCYDGGTLEISTDGGATWSTLPAAAFTAGGYTAVLYSTGSPLGGLPGWCGGTLAAPTQVTADLSAYAGSTARLRWRAGDSGFWGGYPGWFVDSVAISQAGTTAACTPAPPPALDFYTLAPCRLVDTRNAAGPLGGPALAGHAERTFALAGACGVPVAAKALALNLTVVGRGSAGDLRVFPAGVAAPLASVLNFRPGQTRANNAVVGLPATGAVVVRNDAAGPVDLILDVDGYFQ